MEREVTSLFADQQEAQVTEFELYINDLKDRARVFNFTRIDQKLMKIALLEAEIADLQKQIQLLKGDIDEQE